MNNERRVIFKQAELPHLEMSEVNHPNIRYVYDSTKPECTTYIPSLQDLLIRRPCSKKFMPFNEVEYSANIKFRNLKIDKSSNYVYEMERFYINDTIPLFCDASRVSTEHFENCTPFNAEINTRLDYEEGLLTLVTSKLKVLKTNFNYCKVTYALTAAIEIEFPELKYALINLPQPSKLKYTKRKKFIFWRVSLMVDSIIYKFNIAFMQSSKGYDCNIECEDPISGSIFIECFDFLSKYYKRQYIIQDKTIFPIVEDMDYNKIKLTPGQIEIANTLRLIDAFEEHIGLELQPSTGIVDLVKFLSLQTINTGNIDYDLQILNKLKYCQTIFLLK